MDIKTEMLLCWRDRVSDEEEAAMRRTGPVAVIVAVVCAAFVLAPGGSASTGTRFSAAITEEFCAPFATCGTAVTPLGHATVHTVITSFVPLPSGCFSDHHTTTLTFEDGSTLVFAIEGTLCPTSFPNFRFDGTYDVAGGTGEFTGATGSGFVNAFRQNGPIHAVLVGTLVLPSDEE